MHDHTNATHQELHAQAQTAKEALCLSFSLLTPRTTTTPDSTTKTMKTIAPAARSSTMAANWGAAKGASQAGFPPSSLLLAAIAAGIDEDEGRRRRTDLTKGLVDVVRRRGSRRRKTSTTAHSSASILRRSHLSRSYVIRIRPHFAIKTIRRWRRRGKREERRTSRQASAQRWHAPRSRVPKPREKILISARLPCPGAQLASSSLTRTAPFSGLRRSCFSWRDPCDVRTTD